MAKGIIRNATVVTPGLRIEGASIVVEGDRIASIRTNGVCNDATDWEFDAKGSYAVPGFIDIHTHGAAGADATDPDPGAMEIVAKAKLTEGCTSFMPTTLTLPEGQLADSLRNMARYAETQKYAKAFGVHLEGPYINPECCGAQNPAFVRKPDMAEAIRLNEIFPVREITFAAEVGGADEFARECMERGIVASCGHSKATYDEFKKAHDAGLRHLTHFCNQMTPLHHRDIGLVGGGLLHDDVRVEVICDKIHISPEMIKLVFGKKPIGSILAITDSMRASHLPDGPSSLGGLDVVVKDGQARLASNGALAGSVLRMNIALKNIHEVTGLPLEDVVQVTSLNQATEQGMGDKLGRIAAGYIADVAVLDRESFEVQAVCKSGELVRF